MGTRQTNKIYKKDYELTRESAQFFKTIAGIPSGPSALITFTFLSTFSADISRTFTINGTVACPL